MRATESGFNENLYLLAAGERITTANRLLWGKPQDNVMAAYLGGVAVECLFHAYRLRAGEQDIAKHDLRRQAELARFYDDLRTGQRQAVVALVAEVSARWQNNHRYRSAAALRDWIIRNRMHIVDGNSTTRQDVVRFNAEQLVEAATEIVNIGSERWEI
jgi:hypothetical protein